MQDIFLLRKREAECLQEDGKPLYDVLLDQYEEGAEGERLKTIFAELRDGLVELVQSVQGASQRPSGESWKVPVPVAKQREVSRWVADGNWLTRLTEVDWTRRAIHSVPRWDQTIAVS